MFNLSVYVDKQDWNAALRAFRNFDMYHTYDYHKISQSNGEGDPVLFVVTDPDRGPVMCWPTLKRKIPGTELYDLTSVFGYGGPILNEIDLARGSFEFLFDSLRSLGFVSMFSRMHPLLIEGLDLSDLPYIKLDSRLVAIKVRRQENVLNGYRNNHRRDIRRALKSGVRAIVDERFDGIDEFIKIYHQAMADLGADEYYFYETSYIKSLVEATDFKVDLIFAQIDDVRIGGALFITTRGMMQYYIGGVVKEYKALSPLKLILARAHELAIEIGVQDFILGVGADGGDDALFKFKMGFSGVAFQLSVFKRVIDPVAYNAICISKGVDPGDMSYFPAYRQPRKKGGADN